MPFSSPVPKVIKFVAYSELEVSKSILIVSFFIMISFNIFEIIDKKDKR